MSGMGETLAEFIKGLYWLVGILAGLVVVLATVIVVMVVR